MAKFVRFLRFVQPWKKSLALVPGLSRPISPLTLVPPGGACETYLPISIRRTERNSRVDLYGLF